MIGYYEIPVQCQLINSQDWLAVTRYLRAGLDVCQLPSAVAFGCQRKSGYARLQLDPHQAQLRCPLDHGGGARKGTVLAKVLVNSGVSFNAI